MQTTLRDSFSLSMIQATLDGKPATIETKQQGWSGVRVTDCDGRSALFTNRIAIGVIRGNGGHFRTTDHTLVGHALFGRFDRSQEREARLARAKEALGVAG